MSMTNEILAGVIVAVFTALFTAIITWAFSQATTGRKVINALAEMKLAIERVNNDAHRAQDEVAAIRLEVSAVRSDTTNRMSIMADMVTKVLDTADKLIELVRIQNALLVERAQEKNK